MQTGSAEGSSGILAELGVVNDAVRLVKSLLQGGASAGGGGASAGGVGASDPSLRQCAAWIGGLLHLSTTSAGQDSRSTGTSFKCYLDSCTERLLEDNQIPCPILFTFQPAANDRF